MDDNNDYEDGFIYEIRIRQIVFDESTSVTILGSLPNEDDYETSIPWDFLCTFSILTDILLFANDKEKGDLLIKIISEKLSSELEIPTVIDVVEIFGKELHFTNLVYEVTKVEDDPKYNDCYFIDSIEDKDKFFKREGENFNFREHRYKEDIEILLGKSLSELESKSSNEAQMAEYMLLLDTAYNYYLQLLEKDFSEKDARNVAGLTNELMFRIANINHQMINE